MTIYREDDVYTCSSVKICGGGLSAGHVSWCECIRRGYAFLVSRVTMGFSATFDSGFPFRHDERGWQ